MDKTYLARPSLIKAPECKIRVIAHAVGIDLSQPQPYGRNSKRDAAPGIAGFVFQGNSFFMQQHHALPLNPRFFHQLNFHGVLCVLCACFVFLQYVSR